MTSLCPCGSGKKHRECCTPYISGEKPAPTAEAVMRARYSAYVFNKLDYLRESLAPEALAEHDDTTVREWADKAQWRGLEIHDKWAGGENDQEGIVEFTARYAIDGEELSHRERSNFKKVGDHWRYLDGTMVSGPPIRKGKRVGRNEKCPCGSGKKYKKCCGH